MLLVFHINRLPFAREERPVTSGSEALVDEEYDASIELGTDDPARRLKDTVDAGKNVRVLESHPVAIEMLLDELPLR
jgi:hypothetical protein